MHIQQEDGQYSKNDSGDQSRPKALKAPRTMDLNAVLETVRRKMAYTIRGI
jgi:hypothetical protein